MGGATVSGGQLQLDGVAGYCQLPIGNTLGGLTNCTFEAWVTWGAFQNPWSRIFDFGNDTIENIFLTPRNGNNQRVRFAQTIDGGGDEEQTTSGLHFPVGVETHVAVVVYADLGITALYVNGLVAAAAFDTTLSPSDLTAPATNNYLGKSQYPDPYFLGSINEFRVYNEALSRPDVLASFHRGPDAP
jgi:hypothetical protein